MARRIGDEDSEYGLDDDEHGSLIELGSGGGGRGLRRTSTSSVDSSNGGSSATCRWITILFAHANTLSGVFFITIIVIFFIFSDGVFFLHLSMRRIILMIHWSTNNY